MIYNIKTAYCFYIVQLLLQCETDHDLNVLLDKIIENKLLIDNIIYGDNDIKNVFEFVINYRKYNKCILDEKPKINNNLIFKVMIKSFF